MSGNSTRMGRQPCRGMRRVRAGRALGLIALVRDRADCGSIVLGSGIHRTALDPAGGGVVLAARRWVCAGSFKSRGRRIVTRWGPGKRCCSRSRAAAGWPHYVTGLVRSGNTWQLRVTGRRALRMGPELLLWRHWPQGGVLRRGRLSLRSQPRGDLGAAGGGAGHKRNLARDDPSLE